MNNLIFDEWKSVLFTKTKMINSSTFIIKFGFAKWDTDKLYIRVWKNKILVRGFWLSDFYNYQDDFSELKSLPKNILDEIVNIGNRLEKIKVFI